jgi:hypothetical protein
MLCGNYLRRARVLGIICKLLMDVPRKVFELASLCTFISGVNCPEGIWGDGRVQAFAGKVGEKVYLREKSNNTPALIQRPGTGTLPMSL